MVRRIKPLRWQNKARQNGEMCFCGKLRIGGYYYSLTPPRDSKKIWQPSFHFDELNSDRIGLTETKEEAQAAVEQAFLKWLDTFSEEVKE